MGSGANIVSLRLSMEFKQALIRTYTTLKTSSLVKMVWEQLTTGEMAIKLENQFMKISWK